ncbi:MAG: TorF family putative porin [Gammaproteobacteria bacterium]
MKRAMHSKLAGLGAVVIALAAGIAQAEVSSTITIASDYDFRGITQNARSAAYQASLDWSGESGLYAGLWGSNIDFGDDLNFEVDLIAGYGGSITEELAYDVGGTYYKYLGDTTDPVSVDYYELYAGLSYEAVSGKVWFSPDFGNSGDSAWYAEANGDFPVGAGVNFVVHAGYNGGDYWKNDDNGLREFFDYSVGVTRSFGKFDFALKYIDGSDLKEADCSRSGVECTNDVFSSEGKIFVSVATTFPWSKD